MCTRSVLQPRETGRADAPPRREPFLPFSRPTLGEDEEAEVLACLRSGWITSGPRVERFERAWCERLGVPHAIAVNSATAGLHLAIRTLDLRPGDEVIVPALTWPATANVVELCGARAVLADVNASTLCLEPDEVRRRVTERTRAVVPVHFAGQPVDLDGLRLLAREVGIEIVEDAAHAPGARYGEPGADVEIGASGDVVVFSFHPNKNLTTGEGGLIVCRDDARAERLRRLRFHGIGRSARAGPGAGASKSYALEEPGWKYNMLDLQAALGLRQLEKLDAFNAKRAALAARYAERLRDVPEVRPLGAAPYAATHAWHLYVVRVDPHALAIDRDAFMAALETLGIGTGLHYPSLHSLAYYRDKYGFRPASFPNAHSAGGSVMSLPLFPGMTERDVDDVVAAVRWVAAENRRSPA